MRRIAVADWLAVLGSDALDAGSALPSGWRRVLETPGLGVWVLPHRGRAIDVEGDAPVAFVAGWWRGETLPMPEPDFDARSASLEDLAALRAGPLAVFAADPEAGRVHVRRDAGGAATLFEAGAEGRRLFATKLTPLRALLSSADPDPVPLLMFLEHLYVPAPHTPWKGIRQLFPGESRSYETRSGAEVASSQMLRANPRLSGGADYGPGLRGDAAIAELDRGLRAEMEAALEGEASPALLLSSGKDSTSLLIAAPERRRRDLLCITAAPRERGKDESVLARRLAEELGHPIQVETFDDAMLEAALRDDLPAYELPTGDAATAAMLAIAPKIRGPVSSMITGDGGDALFGFPVSDNERRLLALRGVPGVPALCRVLGNTAWVPQRPLIRSLGRPRERFFLGWDGTLPDVRSGIARATEDAWRESLAILDRTSLEAEKAGALQGVWFAAGHFPRARYPAEAVGVPVAFPWVGPHLTAAVYRLATDELSRGRSRKVVLRSWLERYAPDYIAQNPKARFSVKIEGVLARFEKDLAAWSEAPGRTRLAEAGVPAPALQGILRPWIRRRHPAFTRAVYGLVLLETWLARQTS